MDFGPLAKLVGTWRTIATGGVDVAPGHVGSKVGTGNPAMEPYYEQLRKVCKSPGIALLLSYPGNRAN
ncbi:hypothetical protein OKW45_001147 [Paraburkholderia sp. WSM4175]